MMEEITSLEGIVNAANAFRASRILLTSFELRLFTILDHHMMSSADIAEADQSRSPRSGQADECSLRNGAA